MKYIRTKDERIIDISDIDLFEDELANTDFGDGNIGLYAGIPVSSISRVVNGKRQQTNGYIFAKVVAL